MTKYLIIALVGLILITATVLLFNPSQNQQSPPPSPNNSRETARPSSPNTIPNPSLTPLASTSPLPAPTSSADIVRYQSETDKLYADQQKQQDEQYPWLEQMPLQTSNYFVYFETSTNSFTAEIYNSAQSEQLKQDILNRLQALNIDTSKYNINWQIK